MRLIAEYLLLNELKNMVVFIRCAKESEKTETLFCIEQTVPTVELKGAFFYARCSLVATRAAAGFRVE